MSGDFISILCQHLFYLLLLYGPSTALLIVCTSVPIGFDLISIIPLSSAAQCYHSISASPLLSCKVPLNRPIIQKTAWLLILFLKSRKKNLFSLTFSTHILDLLWSQWNKSNTFKQFFSKFHFASCRKFTEQYHRSWTWKCPSLHHESPFHSLSFSSVFLLLREGQENGYHSPPSSPEPSEMARSST